MDYDESFKTFLSKDNLKSLINVFETFLKDRYSMSVGTQNINIKRITFEVMENIVKDDSLKSRSVDDLNKITLSIVKNVVKKKLMIDEKFNTKLIRERAIENKDVITHKVDRPMPSKNEENDKNVTSAFKLMENERKESFIPSPSFEEVHESVNETSMSDIEFKNKIEQLTKSRDDIHYQPLNKVIDDISFNLDSTKDMADKTISHTPNIIENTYIDNDNKMIEINDPKSVYKFNDQKNKDAVEMLKEMKSSKSSFSHEYYEPNVKQKNILKEIFLLVNSQDRNWVKDEKRYNYTIDFDSTLDLNEQIPFYENNPTIPHTKTINGKGVNNITGWLDESDPLCTIYPKYNSNNDFGNIVGYESVKILNYENGNVGNVLKNIHSIQLTKVIVPLNIFLTSRLNIDSASASIDTANKDYDFNVNFPYLLLKIDEFDNVYEGTNNIIRKAFTQLIFESSYRCPNGRGYIILKPSQNEKRIFYPTALSTINRLTISLLKPNGELLNDSRDGLTIYQIQNSSMNNNRLLNIVTSNYFSRNEFYKGDIVRIQNFTIYKSTNSNEYNDIGINKANKFINRSEGHEIIQLGDANESGYYKSFYIKSLTCFDEKLGEDIKDQEVINAIEKFNEELNDDSHNLSCCNYSNGYLLNMSLQHSLSFSIKHQVQDSKVIASTNV